MISKEIQEYLEVVKATCENCRNKDEFKWCEDFKTLHRANKKLTVCRWWSYKSKGLWSNNNV